MVSKKTYRNEKDPAWVFYYDGDCAFCAGVVKWLGRLDFSHRVEWVPYQSLERPPQNLSWSDLDSAAYLDCGNGKLEEGFYAFRKLTIRVLPLFPLAPVFWFPGMHFPGVPLYRWIAQNRYRLSRCRLPGLKPDQPFDPPSAEK